MSNMKEALRQLRLERNLTQAELGRNLGVSRDVIARIENNSQNISYDLVSNYAHFFKLSTDTIGKLAYRFNQPFQYILRAHEGNDLTTEMREQFESWYDRMEILDAYNPVTPILEIPSDEELEHSDEDVKNAGQNIAHFLRDKWNLGNGPISDPINLIEALGFYINGADCGETNFFAVSGKRGADGRPAIFINTNNDIPIERQRFSIFHELGHILLHDDDYRMTPKEIGYGIKKDPKEKLVDCLAGNFQAPNAEIRRIIERLKANKVESQMILILKLYFKVSYQTILYRLRDIGYISQDELKAAFKRFKDRYGNKEPLPMKEPLNFDQERKTRESVTTNYADLAN